MAHRSRPTGGHDLCSKKNHHIAAFETNIPALPLSRPHQRQPGALPSHPSSPPGPQAGATFVSQKKHHLAAFETNIPGPGPCHPSVVAPGPRSHRPGPTGGHDLCFSEKTPPRSLRNKHPRPALPWRPSAGRSAPDSGPAQNKNPPDHGTQAGHNTAESRGLRA
jgi:hypothetical protein